jgi:putative transposase
MSAASFRLRANVRTGVARVIAAWRLARSSHYAARRRRQHPQTGAKCGPRRLSDKELAREIRRFRIRASSTVRATGSYRNVWARLRHKGIRLWKERVLRLMRQNQLLSPNRFTIVNIRYRSRKVKILERA